MMRNEVRRYSWSLVLLLLLDTLGYGMDRVNNLNQTRSSSLRTELLQPVIPWQLRSGWIS